MKQIVFRVDSSRQMGSGHLMRCLTLANRLKNQANISFISRDLEGNLNHLIQKNEFQVFSLPQMQLQNELVGYEKWLTVKPQTDAIETGSILKTLAADCLIVDHYALGAEWEQKMRSFVKKIMVIDDLANREHDCDILLDQNYGAEACEKYSALVPSCCHLYLGAEYVLLREDFHRERENLRNRDGSIKNVLLFFGGSDDTQETQKAIEALACIKQRAFTVHVIVGGSNAAQQEIEKMCDEFAFNFHCQVTNMAEFIQQADLAFGAAGSNTWERCVLGLPAIVTITEENQRRIAENIAGTGAVYNLGYYQSVRREDYLEAFLRMQPNILKYMSKKALQVLGNFRIKAVLNDLLMDEQSGDRQVGKKEKRKENV